MSAIWWTRPIRSWRRSPSSTSSQASRGGRLIAKLRAPPMTLTDDELLARQDALQAEAAAVLDDLDLVARISRVGRPIRTGSAALGLMVARDIDVTSLCPKLAGAPIREAVAPLASNPHIPRLAL